MSKQDPVKYFIGNQNRQFQSMGLTAAFSVEIGNNNGKGHHYDIKLNDVPVIEFDTQGRDSVSGYSSIAGDQKPIENLRRLSDVFELLPRHLRAAIRTQNTLTQQGQPAPTA